jgi:hypothetical protein
MGHRWVRFPGGASADGEGILLNEPPENTPEARACFWWRRGRVELHLEHGLSVHVLFNPPTATNALVPVLVG